MKSLIFDLDDTLLMSGTYKNYNDIDKFLIFIYLINKNLIFYFDHRSFCSLYFFLGF